MAVELVDVKRSTKPDKKWTARFRYTDGRTKTQHFGSRGMNDFTLTGDTEKRKLYHVRHRNDLRTGDPTRAGYLAMFILWNKKSRTDAIADYRRRLKTYNATGKFPIKMA